MLIQGQTGPVTASDNTQTTLRTGKQGGDLIVSELHGRFYEQAYRGNLFSIGTTTTVAMTANHNNTNGLSATLGTAAAATPMIGLWNPSGSGKNIVVLQTAFQIAYNTVATPVPSGPLVLAVSLGNTAISTGLAPFNRLTLQQSGAVAKGFAGATALTGLTNVFTAMESAADFEHAGTVAYGTIANTAMLSTAGGVRTTDGSLIIPPGAVLAYYNTVSTTTFSYTGRILWEEVAI